ncbi:hypothetical protein NHQ30_004984 [Ciborinia camelliae]|nr:hypothetical protein NHQ30_004984 [Ciborinia camelliae]
MPRVGNLSRKSGLTEILGSLLFAGLGLLVPRIKKITSSSQASSEKDHEGNLEIRDTRTGRSYTVPISKNSIDAIAFRRISTAAWNSTPIEHYSSGLKVLDIGFQNTAVCESRITHIDGNVDVVKSFPRGTPDFLIIVAGLSAWAAASPEDIPIHMGGNLYSGKPKAVDSGVIRSITALAVVTALTSCHKLGKKFKPAVPENSFVGNQLLMMGIVSPKTGKPEPWIEKCLSKLWIIYADHEMTNSTAAFLHVTSTLADPISGGIASLLSGSGPLHGGAIDIAYKSFQQIGSKENVAKLIEDVKAKKQRLFGYGHRIYKTVDPRIYHLRRMMDDLDERMASNPLLSVALEIDRIASEDTYFTSRNLKANADLYGCFVFSALGFEPEIITAVASIARSTGILAHWRESMSKS